MPKMSSSRPSKVRKKISRLSFSQRRRLRSVGAMAELGQQLAVVFEINAQHDGDTEYKLSMRDRIEDVIGDILAELNRFFSNGNSGKTSGPCRKTPKCTHFCTRGWCSAPWQIPRASLRIASNPPPPRPPPDGRSHTVSRNARHSRP